MNWHVSIEVAGAGPAPHDDALFDLMEHLTPYHAGVTGTPEAPIDGMNRYGASMLIEADDVETAATRAAAEFMTGAQKVGLPSWPIVRVAVMTETDLDAELTRPNFPVLLGVSELAELLGVSRQRASAVSKTAGFPRPVATLRAGPVWTETSVRRFVDEWERKPGRPRKDPVAV